METLKIEVVKQIIYLNGEKYGKLFKNSTLGIGNKILDVLFSKNKEGKFEISLIVNGLDETEDFKKQVRERYANIPNTELRDRFYRICSIN